MKDLILKELIDRAEKELSSLTEAAKSNHDFATDQEFKAESKYDTRALEASYLAEAEAKRVDELKLEVQILQEVDLKLSDKLQEVCIGALVDLEHNGAVRKYFLIPTAGGEMLKVQNETILVVSVFSPIGDAMLGLKKGESFEVETPKETREYKITNFI